MLYVNNMTIRRQLTYRDIDVRDTCTHTYSRKKAVERFEYDKNKYCTPPGSEHDGQFKTIDFFFFLYYYVMFFKVQTRERFKPTAGLVVVNGEFGNAFPAYSRIRVWHVDRKMRMVVSCRRNKLDRSYFVHRWKHYFFRIQHISFKNNTDFRQRDIFELSAHITCEIL